MEGVLVLVGIVLFLGVIIYLIFLPGTIVSKKTPNTLSWTIGTVATGIIPGIIAALLYRYKNVSPVKAFCIGVSGFLAFSWLIVGILWALGFAV